MADLTCYICGHPIEDEPDGGTELSPPPGQPLKGVVVMHICNECHEELLKAAKREGLWKGALHHNLRDPQQQ